MSSGAIATLLLSRTWALACLFGTALANAAGPGATDIMVEGDAAALRCLVVPARAIEYPRDLVASKTDGIVRVRLTFMGGQERPRREAFFSSADELRSLVLDHVAGYRMPCLSPGETRTVTQEFAFIHGDGRAILPSEPRAAFRARDISCIVTPASAPMYPSSMRAVSPAHGRVLAQAEFVAPDAPPRVDILFNGGHDRFGNAVRAYMEEYRLPCVPAAELPLVVTQQFHFRLEGEPMSLLKDATLASLVGNLADLERHRVRFDFGTMGCPFDLHFVLWQPHARNVVREIERSDPNRRELIEWLRGVDLKLSKRLHDEVVGDSMTVSVPCGLLDLS